MSNILIEGWKEVWAAKKVISLAWLISLLAVTIVGTQAYSILHGGLGNSAEIDKLLHGFDRTVVEDFMNQHKAWKDSLTTPLMISAILFFAISVFNHAGLIACFEKKNYSTIHFVKNGLKYFLPFLAYAFLNLILIISLGSLFFFIYSKLIGQPIEDYDTERPFFYSLLITIALFILKAAGIWMWSLRTRYYYIKGHSFFKSIIEAVKSMYRNAGMSFLLTMMTLLLFALALAIQKWLNEFNSSQSWCAVIAIFIAMMAVMLLRYFVRAWAIKISSNL